MPRRPSSKRKSGPRWLTANTQTILCFAAGLLAATATVVLIILVPPDLGFTDPGPASAPVGLLFPSLQALAEAVAASILLMSAFIVLMRTFGVRLSPTQTFSVLQAVAVFSAFVMAGAMVAAYYLVSAQDVAGATTVILLCFAASGTAFVSAWLYGLRTVAK
jgi:hypothetical protein